MPANNTIRYHKEQSVRLRMLEEKGDLEASCVLDQRHAVQQLIASKDDDVIHVNIAPRVWLSFRKDSSIHPADRRVDMWLEVNEQTTPKRIEQFWPEITKWRSLLSEWQGPNPSGKNGYLQRLIANKNAGKSHQELADLVTHDALNWMEWYYRQQLPGFLDAITRLGRESDDETGRWSEEETDHWFGECAAARVYFEMAGVKDVSAIRAWWFMVLRYLHFGQPKPTAKDSPISGPMLRETLRSFKSKYGESINREEKR